MVVSHGYVIGLHELYIFVKYCKYDSGSLGGGSWFLCVGGFERENYDWFLNQTEHDGESDCDKSLFHMEVKNVSECLISIVIQPYAVFLSRHLSLTCHLVSVKEESEAASGKQTLPMRIFGCEKILMLFSYFVISLFLTVIFNVMIVCEGSWRTGVCRRSGRAQ